MTRSQFVFSRALLKERHPATTLRGSLGLPASSADLVAVGQYAYVVQIKKYNAAESGTRNLDDTCVILWNDEKTVFLPDSQ